MLHHMRVTAHDPNTGDTHIFRVKFTGINPIHNGYYVLYADGEYIGVYDTRNGWCNAILRVCKKRGWTLTSTLRGNI